MKKKFTLMATVALCSALGQSAKISAKSPNARPERSVHALIPAPQPSLKEAFAQIFIVEDALSKLTEESSQLSQIAELVLTHGFPSFSNENQQPTPLLLALAASDENSYEEAFYSLRTIKNFLLHVLSEQHPLFRTSQELSRLTKSLSNADKMEIKKLIEEICLFCHYAEEELTHHYGPILHLPDGTLDVDFEIKIAQFTFDEACKGFEKYKSTTQQLIAKQRDLEQQLKQPRSTRTSFFQTRNAPQVDKVKHLQDQLLKLRATKNVLKTQTMLLAKRLTANDPRRKA